MTELLRSNGRNPMTTLLDLVDELTKPTTVRSQLDNGRTVTRRVRGLLDELEAAIANNIGERSRGRLPSERNPLAFAALEARETIDGRLRSWIMTLGGTAGKDISLARLCRAWYTLHLADNNTPDALLIPILDGWVKQIQQVLDPPKVLEVTRPCPICGKEWIDVGPRRPDGTVHPLDSEIVRTLNAMVVATDTGPDYQAICRNCDAVWKGIDAVRFLSMRLDETPGHADPTASPGGGDSTIMESA